MLLAKYRKFRKLILLGGTADYPAARMLALDNDEVLFREALAKWEARHAIGLDAFHKDIDDGLLNLRNKDMTVPQVHAAMGRTLATRQSQVPELRMLFDSVPMWQEPFLLPLGSPTDFLDTLRIMWIASGTHELLAKAHDSALERQPHYRTYDMSPELRLWLTREWIATYMQPLLVFRRYINTIDQARMRSGIQAARNAAAIEQSQLPETAVMLTHRAPLFRQILDMPDDPDRFCDLIIEFDFALPN